MIANGRVKVVVIGGVAGGASAATRVRRLSEDVQIVLFERGKYVSFANCGLPYHIGGQIADRQKLLVQTPQGLRDRYHIDVRTETEVVRIDRGHKRVVFRNVATGHEDTESYDKLVISSGAEPLRPPIPGSDRHGVHTLRTLADMDAIKERIETMPTGRAVVIGAGYIGLEMTEALRERGLQVDLVELAPQVMNLIDPEMAMPVQKHLELHEVKLHLNNSVTGIEENADELKVRLSSGETIDCGLVILAAGVRPENRLAREAGLKLGQTGGVAVNPHMQTSDPDIYAVGDVAEVEHLVGGFPALVPLAGPANRQGRIAADHIFGRDSRYRRTQGTAICKVFDLAVGMTGLSEKELKRREVPFHKVYVHPASHASYYPGANPIALKLLFDPKGKVLGAQAVGTSGVDKRIDVLAVAIRAGLTVDDLKDLELCYAPPFGSAKDPVNYAGFVAANVLAGDVQHIYAEELSEADEDRVLLDVRNPEEVAAGTIPGSTIIPLHQLRSRLDELPRDKEVVAFCQVGLRGYLACRTLMQKGFACRNLTGGYKTYQMVTAAMPPEDTKPEELNDDAGEKSHPHSETVSPPAPAPKTSAIKQIDARGLQCPGPIMTLARELDGLRPGEALTIRATDPGFAADVEAWCRSTGHRLVEVGRNNGHYHATVVKQDAPAATTDRPAQTAKDKTMVVFSGDFDKAMASFIIANGAAAMGGKVTMFFTFWGLNILRCNQNVPVKKTLIERMFGWMMPRGADRLALSKMHMGGLGTWMIKGIMRSKRVASLPELIDSAKRAGVRLVACSMSMDLMGIKREELIDGVEEGGVALYLDRAEHAGVNLFI